MSQLVLTIPKGGFKRATTQAGGATASPRYFYFTDDGRKLQLSERKLPMPVLAIGGAKANGELLAQQMKLVASDVTVVVLSDTGHWVLEERPKETTEALMKFL